MVFSAHIWFPSWQSNIPAKSSALFFARRPPQVGLLIRDTFLSHFLGVSPPPPPPPPPFLPNFLPFFFHLPPLSFRPLPASFLFVFIDYDCALAPMSTRFLSKTFSLLSSFRDYFSLTKASRLSVRGRLLSPDSRAPLINVLDLFLPICPPRPSFVFTFD